jgi:hypothetical protein
MNRWDGELAKKTTLETISSLLTPHFTGHAGLRGWIPQTLLSVNP